MMALPDIVVCDPSPWDFDKAESLNISIQQLSYMSQLLYPLFSPGVEFIDDTLKEMDRDYQTLLQRFDNNPISLLNNVTKSCSHLIFYCILGTRGAFSGEKCCEFIFPNVEYTPMFKCYSSGGRLDYKMPETSQAYGITVYARIAAETRYLVGTIPVDWSNFLTGISAGVADAKANLYSESQTNLKLLEPDTYNVMPLERREIDSSERPSYFQFYEGRKKRQLEIYL